MGYIITKKKKDKSEPDMYLHKNKCYFVGKQSKSIGVFNYKEACKITVGFVDDKYWFLKTLVP